MKHSVKLKLFVIISGLIIFYVLLSWVLNSKFLVKYYFINKKHTLVESYKLINSIYKGDADEVLLELEKLESMKGLRIIIQDKSYESKYDSWAKRRGFKPILHPHVFPANENTQNIIPELLIQLKANDILNGNTIIANTRDYRLKSEFVNLVSLLNAGDFLLLNMPIAPIEESARIANKFFLITGLITILSGSIIVFIVSGRFTRPILELNEITQGMLKLDFSKKCLINSRDEIGELGNSINSLSEQLEKSIFELKQANIKLKEDIEQERKIDEMRKEFIANVSHELKTPIAMIQGYAEGLKVNVNEDEENKNFYCEVIMDEAAKMNRLVRQLLTLAQIESGDIQPELVNFDIIELVERVIKKNALIFKEKNIRVIIENAEETTACADIDMTEQVLTNYITNAINHVDNHKLIKLNIRRCGNKIRISVFNTGMPVPEESIDKIWTSFYKADKSRTRAYGGTGLGLSVVKVIQEALGNDYGAENVLGGVEFWFNIDRMCE